MSFSPKVANEIARLMRDPNSMRGEWERLERSRPRRHYDPKQPRVPAGHSDGGQWTDAGRAAGHDVFQRPYNDRSVLGSDALDDLIAAQLPIEKIQPRTNRGRIPNPIELVDALRLGLYNDLSARNGPGQQAIVEFRATQYLRNTVDLALVGVLSRSELGNRCPLREKVQELTDLAAAEVRAGGTPMSPQQFGTAVHANLEMRIRKFNHRDLKAEVSFLKGQEENRGVKDTIRIDALERVNHDTVCIHDVKTGRGGLTLPRMLEMVVNSQRAFNGQIRHFIVTEVRPSQ